MRHVTDGARAQTMCQWAARTTFQEPNAGLFLARRSGGPIGGTLPGQASCGCMRPRALPSPRRLRSPRSPMQSLRDWIKRAAPSDVQIMATLLCVATSIQLLHARGVAHGNVHLSSIYRGLDSPLWLFLDSGFATDMGTAYLNAICTASGCAALLSGNCAPPVRVLFMCCAVAPASARS